jgi:pyruvate-ferredoxin/flavodoxin oxidoreductase
LVDADRVAREAGLGGRINTVMQTCFFALSGVLPRDEAIAHIKRAIEKSYGGRGRSLLDKNFAAVDASLGGLARVQLPGDVMGGLRRISAFARNGSEVVESFVERVTARILAGEGDLLPVSALPVDGTFPTGTARFEKRGIAREIPIWDADLCIQCGLCPIVCPHAAIRMKPYRETALAGAPKDFQSRPWSGREFAGLNMTIQVAPDDCTGCGVCVDVCPARSKEVAKHKAIDMRPRPEHLERERANFQFFLQLPEVDRAAVDPGTVKGSQALQPLFEFSGACAGCGETPYLKLLTQLYGDRLVVANATGCSSIFGGNLPTTPWSKDAHGRGPAWANSLFEDNAEFGFGMRLSFDQQEGRARELLAELATQLPEPLVCGLLDGDQETEAGLAEQRARVADLKRRLGRLDTPAAHQLLELADSLVRRQVWIVGGDGWAYDIGFGGLDHVLASDRDVNILVLDTGVYSNTGGQASKATPRGAVAKFAASGKALRRKDLGLLAASYGHVYVAQIALGANPKQTIEAFREASSYRGPSLILAYSHCIAHGIEMSTAMSHQKEATGSGFWPLFRYDPRRAHAGEHPFQLDSRKPKIAFKDFAVQEGRFASLQHSDPKASEELLRLAQGDIDEQWRLYEQMAGMERDMGSKEVTP